MPRDREQFESWLTEWRDHTWSRHNPREWPRLQVADSDVHERTRRILSVASQDDMDRLAVVADAVRAQRDNQNRCRASIGEEALTLQQAGGTWQEIADWTTMDEKTVRTLARTPRPKAGPNAQKLADELAALVAKVPANPFFRIAELLAASRFFEAVANELDDVTDWLCFELSSSGVGRTHIARRAQVSQLTVARRISRARRNTARHRGTG